MRILRPTSEIEVVEAFIRAELDSPRFGKQTRAALAEHGEPLAALVAVRGWGRNEGMFRNGPDELTWWRVAMTPDEVLSMLYIHWNWWLKVTNGSRRPVDSSDGPEGYEPIARAAEANPELIAVREREGARIVCVEGHIRLTSYAFFPQYLPSELELYLGESPEIRRWGSY